VSGKTRYKGSEEVRDLVIILPPKRGESGRLPTADIVRLSLEGDFDSGGLLVSFKTMWFDSIGDE